MGYFTLRATPNVSERYEQTFGDVTLFKNRRFKMITQLLPNPARQQAIPKSPNKHKYYETNQQIKKKRVHY